MLIQSDESGQGAAEYVLLFGGVIIIAITSLLLYRNYFTHGDPTLGNDVNNVRANLSSRG